jgi:hypothetical protein
MDITSKSTGDTLSAQEFNQIPNELEHLISVSGLAPSDLDLTQVAKAVTQMVSDGDFYTTGGTPDAIILSPVAPRIAPSSLENGFKARFISASDNTGIVTVNIGGLGAKSVYKRGADLVAEDIKAGNIYELVYVESENAFEMTKFLPDVEAADPKNFRFEQKDFIQAYDKDTIVIKANTIITLQVVGEDAPRIFKVNQDTTYDLASILNSGSVTAGTNYYIYLVAGSGSSVNVVASTNSTYPVGYTANNSRKIGGLHTLCVSVTSANAPALVDTNIWTTHPAIGYNAGDIIPNSVWCLAHRPISDPSGMVYVDKIDMWVDIYLQSGTNLTAGSVYGATVTDSRTQIQHQWDMDLQNKKLATDNDFIVFAEGSNQKTAIKGSASPNPKIAGGHLDTNNKRMISGYFVEECCGYLVQWLDEIAPTGGSAYSGYGDEGTRGDSYGMPPCLRAGGNWAGSSHCGSRSRAADDTRSLVDATYGGRGVSRPLVLNV